MLSQIIILIILIALNAFFAASEIAYISLNDSKIAKQAKEGNKKAKQIEKMLKTPSKFLATIQIGITLAGFLSSAFASDAFADVLFTCALSVTSEAVVSYTAFPPLPRQKPKKLLPRRFISVALALESPPPDVIRHPAL